MAMALTHQALSTAQSVMAARAFASRLRKISGVAPD